MSSSVHLFLVQVLWLHAIACWFNSPWICRTECHTGRAETRLALLTLNELVSVSSVCFAGESSVLWKTDRMSPTVTCINTIKSSCVLFLKRPFTENWRQSLALYQRLSKELQKSKQENTKMRKREIEEAAAAGRRGLSQMLLNSVSSDTRRWLYSQYFR